LLRYAKVKLRGYTRVSARNCLRNKVDTCKAPKVVRKKVGT